MHNKKKGNAILYIGEADTSLRVEEEERKNQVFPYLLLLMMLPNGCFATSA